VAQLPTEQLHALLEAVQPLLKPSRKAKAPPTKSGGAGASSSKRKRRSKGDDASDEEDEGDEEGPEEEEPTHSSTADADDGRAFEGALLTLNVLTLPQIPRELFVDESLEGVLQASALARARDRSPPPCITVLRFALATRHSGRLCISVPLLTLRSCANITWR
jgi:hypothetical protein